MYLNKDQWFWKVLVLMYSDMLNINILMYLNCPLNYSKLNIFAMVKIYTDVCV